MISRRRYLWIKVWKQVNGKFWVKVRKPEKPTKKKKKQVLRSTSVYCSDTFISYFFFSCGIYRCSKRQWRKSCKGDWWTSTRNCYAQGNPLVFSQCLLSPPPPKTYIWFNASRRPCLYLTFSSPACPLFATLTRARPQYHTHTSNPFMLHTLNDHYTLSTYPLPNQSCNANCLQF